MNYSHLSIIERGQLEMLYGLGWTARAIGLKLGRHSFYHSPRNQERTDSLLKSLITPIKSEESRVSL